MPTAVLRCGSVYILSFLIKFFYATRNFYRVHEQFCLIDLPDSATEL
jgi:hypothetical protein